MLAEHADLVVAPVAPELEHHVGAADLAVLLDRRDAVVGGPGNRLALVEELVGHLAKLHVAFTGDAFGASGRAIDVEFLVRDAAPKIVIEA